MLLWLDDGIKTDDKKFRRAFRDSFQLETNYSRGSLTIPSLTSEQSRRKGSTAWLAT